MGSWEKGRALPGREFSKFSSLHTPHPKSPIWEEKINTYVYQNFHEVEKGRLIASWGIWFVFALPGNEAELKGRRERDKLWC